MGNNSEKMCGQTNKQTEQKIIINNNNLLHLFNLLSYYAQWPWRPGGMPRQPLLLAAVAYPLHKLVLIVRFIHLIGNW